MAATTTHTEAPVTVEVQPVHQPYVPDQVHMREFTWPALIVGAILGIIFGASSLYLVLKVGLTVSASIPVAVLSITLFRLFSNAGLVRRATILENNIVQTTGSAGESIAFGVGVTMPALMLLGFEMDIGRVMVVSILGGLLGILMMIPLRRAFIVKQHGVLKYPEGTACAEVLIVGEQGGASAKTVFTGFGIAFIYQFLWQGLKLWKDTAATSLNWFKGAVPAIEVNPALLGVGYIIGTKISCVMAAGGVLASFVLIPAIRLFGDGLTTPIYPAKTLIKDMAEDDIWHEYVLYIGAGAVAAGGIISLCQALPLILGSIQAGLRDIRASQTGSDGNGTFRRTDHDLSLRIVGFGSLALVAAIWATEPLHRRIAWIPDLHMNLVGALLIVIFGFLFVTVSSRITGEIGSSSNPISGMTVATLLLTCLVFVFLGWTKPEDRLTALSVAAVVCIAASNGGTTSQDLKTGYLVGATPKWQQIGILVGALSSALVIGWILIQLNRAYTIYTKKDLPTLKQPLDIRALGLPQEKAKNDEKLYYVWHATEGNAHEIPPGKYLLNEQGQIAYLVDPGINGKRSRTDEGAEVHRFRAPKAQLMSLITDGILRGKLPWSLVLLGVSIAVVLELCGVPSLPFAVGVYLPLSSSTPIFAGGLVRYVADRYSQRNASGPVSETESDSSPGVLLATGYIAGGAIAGVLIAFLSFSDTIPSALARWQFTQVPVADVGTSRATRVQGLTIKAQAIEIADKEVPPASTWGENEARVQALANRNKAVEEYAGEVEELNKPDLPRYAMVKAGTVLKLPQHQEFTTESDGTLAQIANAKGLDANQAQLFKDLNIDRIGPAPTWVERIFGWFHNGNRESADQNAVVPAGTVLKLPEHAEYRVEEKSTLGEVAEAVGIDPDKSQVLLDLNKDIVSLPTGIPAGATMKIPQRTSPSLIAFGFLMMFLCLVGMGRLMQAAPPGARMASNAVEPNGYPFAGEDRTGLVGPQT
jgi:putative OPT family oligopeptide transporter